MSKVLANSLAQQYNWIGTAKSAAFTCCCGVRSLVLSLFCHPFVVQTYHFYEVQYRELYYVTVAE